MEFWSVTGGIASAVGIIVSLVGLFWAIKEARGARTASRAAEAAASETRDRIASHLQAVELQRAIALIERIKTLHDSERWEASGQHYQTLREMLSYVIARCPRYQTGIREKLATARAIVGEMDNFVRKPDDSDISSSERSRLNQSLNEIQSDLEELASNLGFGDSLGEER